MRHSSVRFRFATIRHHWLSLALALGALASLTFAGPGEGKTWQVVRIASEGARPPFNYLDGNNQLAGFEIDLGRELCKRMQVSCTFVAQDWDGMISGLLAHHYDAIMAAMKVTDERERSIGFSEPYARMPSAFLAARKHQIHGISPEDLAGHSIGVAADGTHEAYLRDKYPGSDIKTYNSLEDAILDLAEGRIDTVFGDKDAIEDFMTTRREAQCCKFLADVPYDPNYFGPGIAVGLRPEDSNLRAMFDKAIDAVVADGTYAQIRAKYFDFAIY